MISNVELINFRKFDNISLDLSQKLVFIIGDNASGKTSILEAIYYATRLKSERTNNYKDLIKYEQPYAKIKVKTDINTLEVVLSENNKLYKKNNIEIKRASDFVGNTKLLLFSPNDINLIKGAPSVRRKFLDMEISLINKKYLETLSKTNYYLRQRNLVLQGKNVDLVALDIFTKNLSDLENLIIKSRIKFIELINEKINQVHSSICPGETIKIIYKCSLDLDNSYKNYKDLMNKEIRYKTTLIGFHRDDFIILLNEKDASKFSSEGQMRNIVISLKIALVLVYEAYLNVSPILLLDDLFSYLDLNRQKNIVEFLKTRPQTIITTTSLSNLDIDKDKALIIKL